MTEYRRAYLPGATWFFMVNLAKSKRRGNRLLVDKAESAMGLPGYRKPAGQLRLAGDEAIWA
jgi:hypothetical protein